MIFHCRHINQGELENMYIIYSISAKTSAQSPDSGHLFNITLIKLQQESPPARPQDQYRPLRILSVACALSWSYPEGRVVPCAGPV